MTNYEKISASIDAFTEWWVGNVRCCGCPLELPCDDTAHCEKAVRKYLSAEIDEHCSDGKCDFGR